MILSRTPRRRLAWRVFSRFALAVSLLLLTVSGIWKTSRPVIVLISIDTLRADHVGAYGYSKPTTPFLDSLAARGLVFEEAIVPLPATSASHASLLTSVRPWKHGVLSNGHTMAKVDTLAMALKRVGYYTAGSVGVGHLGGVYGFARGFDSFSAPRGEADTSDVVNARALAAVDRYRARAKRQPLFLFVHYFDCHAPYRWWDPNDPDKAIATTWEETKNRPKQIRRYDEGVRHVDDAVRHLYTNLEQRGLTKNLIFVVTADHGEQIGDHGYDVGHADIYRETVRVPLIIAGHEIPQRRVKENVSIMDVAVTLARLGGTRIVNEIDGRDLEPAIERASTLFGWLAPDAPKRAFTVIGYPGYSMSILYVESSKWFIKNFDHVYRDSWISTPAPAENRPQRTVGAAQRSLEDVTYTLPVRSYRPYYVTVEHVAKTPGCEATAVMKILPSTRYFLEPVKFKGSIRFTVPAARLDSVALSISPPSCAGETRFSAARFGDAALPAQTAKMTDLYNYLVERRKSTQDELYDIGEDPAMLRNLRDPQLIVDRDRALAERYNEIAAVDVSNQTVPPEEQRRLRSLGYLQ